MNQDWNNVEIKFGTDAASNYDVAVVDFGSRQSLSDLLKNHPQAKNALAEEFKKLKKDESESDESAAPKVIKIHYEGKGGLHAVIVNGNPTAYVLQSSIRSAMCDVFSNEDEARSINVSLKGLKDSRVKEVLEWISSLATMTRFQAAVFGKREKEVKKMAKLVLFVQTTLAKSQAEEAVEQGRILGFCNNQVRYLADLPSNILNPRTYRDRAEKIAKELKVDFEFLDTKKLEKKGAGAFLAVVAADQNERGGIVHLHYSGKKAKKKVAIVGKGICFDTGGYNVKVGEYMYNMHRDMTGSAVALSLFRALVEMEAPYEVHAYLALAENLISHEGYRPNDVVTAANGMSIEVIDTDAEGRMVLSDTLAIASEEKPDFIIDFATLTGSVVRAIDTRRCGAYSNEMRVGRLAVDVGDRCGERVWNFPIGEDYNESLKSDTADIRQCSSSNSADHIYAATFLSKFVGKKIPWVHVDLAADTNKGGLGLVPTDTTGFGVRFGLNLIQEMLK